MDADRKNLKNFCVKVSNDLERLTAVKFYQLVTGYEAKFWAWGGPYIGTNYHGKKSRSISTFICSGTRPCDKETVVEFKDIETLANTPLRKDLLKQAREVSNIPALS